MTFPLSSNLPTGLKIRKSSEFKEIFDRGARFNTENFTIIYAPNTLGIPRLGLVVSKKSSPTAVGRNRIKRLVREAFRRNKELFRSLDLVIVAKKQTAAIDYRSVEEEITQIAKLKSS